MISDFFNKLWHIFLNGLFTILPLILTLALFRGSFRIAKVWIFDPIHELLSHTFFNEIPYSEVVLVFGLVMIIGLITKIFLLKSLIHQFEKLIFKIPLIRPVYSGIKQLVDAFSIQEKISFKRVVFVEFPRKGLYSIGFLTSSMPVEIAPDKEKKYYNIFVPTTPNPTTGFFIVVADDELVTVKLTRQEAMAMVISGGIILPEKFSVHTPEQTADFFGDENP